MGLKLAIKSDDTLRRKISAIMAYDASFRQRVSEVVRVRAFDVVAGAKRLVPVSTGALRRSIRPDFFNFGLSAVIGSWLPYAARQEFDASLDHTPRLAKTRKIRTKSGDIGSVIKGTAQKNPDATWGFLRKSLRNVEVLFLDDLRALVNGYGDAWQNS